MGFARSHSHDGHRHAATSVPCAKVRPVVVSPSAGREIDFIVTRDGKPLFAVECKTGERDLSRNIPYFAGCSNIPVIYQVHTGVKDVEFAAHRARILPLAALAGILKV